jgi:hypothetical protein
MSWSASTIAFRLLLSTEVIFENAVWGRHPDSARRPIFRRRISLVRQRTDLAVFPDYSGHTFSQEKSMKSTHTISALMLVATTVLGGCASNSPQQTSTP